MAPTKPSRPLSPQDADGLGATSDQAGGAGWSHERVAAALKRLTDAVLADDSGASREVCEGMLRVIGLVVRLHDEHQIDQKGRCAGCGRRRRCPMQNALSAYLTQWGDPAPPRPDGAGQIALHSRRADS